jgi:hypothetical protein
MALALAKQLAPPVRFPFGRSPWLGWLLLALGILAGSGVALFAFTVGSYGLDRAGLNLAFLAWCVAASASFVYWVRTPQGWVRWTGQEWILHLKRRRDMEFDDDGVFIHGVPAVLCDLQSVLWVTLKRDGQDSIWIFLERGACPERWGDLRRAVYSPAMQAAASAVPTNEASSREP